jgi:uncharacterized membrane protein
MSRINPFFEILLHYPTITTPAMAATFSPSRLEAFSDGVIAVIITIMVLDLKIPHQDGILGLRTVAPTLGVYALSFTFVAIYWVNHHLLIHRLREASPRILWANLIWLFCLSLLPFFTSYVLDKREDNFSVAFYAGSLLMIAMTFMLLRLAVGSRQRAERTFQHTDAALQFKHWGSLAVYLLAIPLAYLSPLLSLIVIAAVTAMWIIPTLGVERCDEAPAATPSRASLTSENPSAPK